MQPAPKTWREARAPRTIISKMRVFVVVVVALSLIASTAAAGTRGKRPAKHAKQKATKPVGVTTTAKKVRDRSIGAPWSGRLQGPARLAGGDGYHLRRPQRTYGTRTTVAFIRQAIRDVFEVHPRAHVLAIGDLSAESGGWISEHSSHQSGRDVDLGLFYKSAPRGYPGSFVRATDETLDYGPMWTLLASLARTDDEDGGVQMIFLDQKLQHAIRTWAKKRGFSDKRIARVLRLMRHEPHHTDHLHVRFKCRARDTKCR